MMAACMDYLTNRLTAAGCRKVCTSLKMLKSHVDSHVGAVLPDKNTFARSGQKKLYTDEAGNRHKRWRLYDRDCGFVVVIGEYNLSAADKIFEAFMTSLDRGIVIDGNWVEIVVEDADWVDKDDSILKADIAVQLHIKFIGGVYKDTDFARITEYEVQDIRPEEV